MSPTEKDNIVSLTRNPEAGLIYLTQPATGLQQYCTQEASSQHRASEDDACQATAYNDCQAGYTKRNSAVFWVLLQ